MKWGNLEIKDFLPRFGASSLIFNETLFIMGGSYKDKTPIATFNFSKILYLFFSVLNLSEENLVTSSDCQGDYISVIGGTAVIYQENLILWGGLKSEEEAISKISYLQLGIYSFFN